MAEHSLIEFCEKALIGQTIVVQRYLGGVPFEATMGPIEEIEGNEDGEVCVYWHNEHGAERYYNLSLRGTFTFKEATK